MADNFNLRSFLTENNLTKNTQLLKEGSDYGYEALMDVVDTEYDGDPTIAAAVEDAYHNGDIDTLDFGHDPSAPSNAVAQIVNGHDIEAAQQSMGFEEEGVEEDLQESKLTDNEKRLVEMVEDALGVAPQVSEEPVYEEEIEEAKPLPKYESIEELMKEIEHGTNEAAHKYKMDEMKRVYEALEAKVSSLEEGEHAEHIDQKAVKQMRKDIAALRKEFDKKFTGKEKKEAPKKEKEVVALAEGFDLRKFLAENRK